MNEFRIATIFPFWRFAVCPTSNHSPGIPFFSEAEARAFFEETKRVLPWAGSVLVRRTSWFKRVVEVVEEYEGNPEHPLFVTKEN